MIRRISSSILIQGLLLAASATVCLASSDVKTAENERQMVHVVGGRGDVSTAIGARSDAKSSFTGMVASFYDGPSCNGSIANKIGELACASLDTCSGPYTIVSGTYYTYCSALKGVAPCFDSIIFFTYGADVPTCTGLGTSIGWLTDEVFISGTVGQCELTPKKQYYQKFDCTNPNAGNQLTVYPLTTLVLTVFAALASRCYS